MKKIFSLFILIIFSAISSAQHSENHLKIEEYVIRLKEFQNDYKPSEIRYVNESKFKKIIKETYEAIEIAPTELNKLFSEDSERWQKEITMKKTQVKMNYRVIENLILNEIKRRYSNIIYGLTRIPVFIRAKVKGIRKEYDNDGFEKNVITLESEEVLKGKVNFIFQPKFEVYYRNYEQVPQEKDFKVDQSYLFPLWDRNEPGNPEFAIATWLDGSGSRFLIKNNILFDKNNFFEMGERVKWEEFSKQISEIIFKIKNTLEY